MVISPDDRPFRTRRSLWCTLLISRYNSTARSLLSVSAPVPTCVAITTPLEARIDESTIERNMFNRSIAFVADGRDRGGGGVGRYGRRVPVRLTLGAHGYLVGSAQRRTRSARPQVRG